MVLWTHCSLICKIWSRHVAFKINFWSDVISNLWEQNLCDVREADKTNVASKCTVWTHLFWEGRIKLSILWCNKSICGVFCYLLLAWDLFKSSNPNQVKGWLEHVWRWRGLYRWKRRQTKQVKFSKWKLFCISRWDCLYLWTDWIYLSLKRDLNLFGQILGWCLSLLCWEIFVGIHLNILNIWDIFEKRLELIWTDTWPVSVTSLLGKQLATETQHVAWLFSAPCVFFIFRFLPPLTIENISNILVFKEEKHLQIFATKMPYLQFFVPQIKFRKLSVWL